MSRVPSAILNPTVTELVGNDISGEPGLEFAGGVRAVNGQGVAVGSSMAFRAHALKWESGSVTDLHAQSGAFENESTGAGPVRRSIIFESSAPAINDGGAVVGSVSSEEEVVVRILGLTLWWVRRYVNTAVQDMVKLFPGGAADINAAGQIAGHSYEGTRSSGVFPRRVGPREPFAVRWENGRITRLIARSSAQQSLATGINDHGHVVGYNRDETLGAWLWRDGQLTSFGIPGFRPTAINNAGQVVGRREVAGHSLAMSWTEAGADAVLPLLPGHVASGAFDINNAGETVGYSEPDWKIQRRAVMWSSGVAHDLTAMLPADSGWVLYQATGISDNGHIVGYGSFEGKNRPFLLTWSQPGPNPV